MPQHWSVYLVEDVMADGDHQIRADPDDVPVERGVVEFAHRQAIGDDRLTSGSLSGRMCAAQAALHVEAGKRRKILGTHEARADGT